MTATDDRHSGDQKRHNHPWLRRAGYVLLGVVLVIVAYYGLFFILRGPTPTDQQVVAHRGGAALAPENTLTAFQNAVTVGAKWIEFDIHRTKDGELVIMHDDTVDRTTNGSGMIKDMTAADFAALQMADGKTPPTLDAVIDIAKKGGIGMFAEVKSPELYPGLGLEVLQKIEDADYVDHTVIISFGLDELANIKKANPDQRVCALYMNPLKAMNPQPEDADMVCPMGETAILFPWVIKRAHDQGREIYVWPWKLDNAFGYRLLFALGVDGVIANDPVAAQQLIDR